MRGLLIASAGALLAAGAAIAATAPTNEDLRHLTNLMAPALSPDGKQVLFTRVDGTADGGRGHVWLGNVTAGSAARQLTQTPDGADAESVPADPHGETAPAWLPDGEGILFLAKRGKTRDLFRLSLSGGEPIGYTLKLVPLTAGKNPKPEESMPADITDLALSPDGKTLAVIAHDPESAADKTKHDAKDDPSWVDHDPHRDRLVLLGLDPSGAVTGSPLPVAIPDDVKAVAWADDSARLLALSDAPNDAAGNAPAGRVWLVEKTAQATALAGLPPTIQNIAWSPNGKSLAFDAQAAADTPPGYADLYLYDLDTRKTHDLSQGFAGSLVDQAPIFAADGKSIVQAVSGGVGSSFASFDISGGAPSILAMAEPVADLLATNRARTGWVYRGSRSDRPRALYVTTMLEQPGAALGMPATADFAGEPATVVHWQNDGLMLEGLLYLPKSAAAGHPVPLVVDVHGGPLGAWQDGFEPFAQLLMARGWAVLLPNPRGSEGYGASFAAANKNDLGGGDFRDIMAGVDAMLKTQPIDATRLALIGYSYGGEMAGFAEGKTTRFKTIVSAAPVIDQYSEFGTEATESWYDRWYFGQPWRHPEEAWRQSPLAGAGAAKTPFLLLQGESDTTDPAGQSREMYRALRQEGVAAELVLYPRETHATLGRAIYGAPSTEPWHAFDARKRIIEALETAFG